MLRVLIALFWVSLIVGTLVAHSVVANWAVTLALLYFTARWWAGRRRAASSSTAAPQSAPPNSWLGAGPDGECDEYASLGSGSIEMDRRSGALG